MALPGAFLFFLGNEDIFSLLVGPCSCLLHELWGYVYVMRELLARTEEHSLI